ncbi:hypothetical protein EHQ16_00635 [Leptospira kanakyensis]|uniref:Uncharacterized protein n=1 Tax=Leptospira kanakyensis TaxID=2484968 RepID=A0A6N4QQV7_9LEPT|nr:hypothetical protein [Leptospira kanakyensis]TGK45960.1 hypothetical protein EHQ11_19630 [Leptospira kanakyensis]TGK64929.1 hypothetical protein EHQ16_00635 [Leptospira kanakyensis]TGK76735.1 hypothetical protein EHQ18_00145 [Leptospira kanakyensis]
MNILERKLLLIKLKLISSSQIIDWTSKLLSKNNLFFNTEKLASIAGLQKSDKYESESVELLLLQLVLEVNPNFHINNLDVKNTIIRCLKRKAILLTQKKLDILTFLKLIDSVNYLYNDPIWFENINYFYSSIQDSENTSIEKLPKLEEEIQIFLNRKDIQ